MGPVDRREDERLGPAETRKPRKACSRGQNREKKNAWSFTKEMITSIIVQTCSKHTMKEQIATQRIVTDKET